MRRPASPYPRRQRAQILVLFAFALIPLAATVGLALDGGNLYLQRRTAQTAADAGALAGARALSFATSLLNNTTISTAICTFAQANSFGTTPAIQSAYFVQSDGITKASTGATGDIITSSGQCATPPSVNIPSNATGVRVEPQIGPFSTMFLPVVGITQLSAAAQASASVTGLTGITANLPPLAGCGEYMLLQSGGNQSILLTNPWRINPARITDPPTVYKLQGAQVGQNSPTPPCASQGGSSWKGKIDQGQSIPSFPTDVSVDTGNGTIDALMRTMCGNISGDSTPTQYGDCFMFIPISGSTGETGIASGEARIVLVACMSVWEANGNVKWFGALVSSSTCAPYAGTVFGGSWTAGSGDIGKVGLSR